ASREVPDRQRRHGPLVSPEHEGREGDRHGAGVGGDARGSRLTSPVSFSCRNLAIHVPDLGAAEAFYTSVFDLELLFRESEREDERWHTIRGGLDWDEIGQRASLSTWSRWGGTSSCSRSSRAARARARSTRSAS